jgi:23S rRNA (pseudouridine1915-N3)-methyltransferase
MRIRLIAVGEKMPQWVTTGYEEYAKRLQHGCTLSLHEISAGKRGKGADIKRLTDKEGEQMLALVPSNSHCIALDVKGKAWSTEQLTDQMKNWQQRGGDVSLLIGGPEGLAQSCYQRANQLWSLSPLTFPHPLVRVIVVEQIYRAWSLLHNHPYHRP